MGKSGQLESVPASEFEDTVYANVKSKNLRLSSAVKDHIFDTDNTFSNFTGFLNTKYVLKAFNKKSPSTYYEDPIKWDNRVLGAYNSYQFVYSHAIHNIMNLYGTLTEVTPEATPQTTAATQGTNDQNNTTTNNQQGQTNGQSGQQGEQQTTTTNEQPKNDGPAGTTLSDDFAVSVTTTAGSPALFNPMMAVNALGIMQDVPLLNNIQSKRTRYGYYEPTIENLIRGSKDEQGILGNSRYSLNDFLYCKDLGKVSNTHLLTLRKFSHPVGDHIYEWSSSKGHGTMTMQTGPDVGRLIAWFGTDDNKLEDICKYEMKMTWKEIKNQIQEIDSKEESDARGPLGMIVNALNPAYNKFQNTAYSSPNNSLLGALASKSNIFRKFTGSGRSSDSIDTLRISSDNHKVWEPKNTVRDTHLYDGQLILSQDITLTFSYKMRSYNNINGKSAFLDLLGNILEVTYQRGRYWKGETRFIGPPQNKQGWQKANALIDNAWDQMGDTLQALKSGDWDLGNMLGNVSNVLGNLWNSALGSLGIKAWSVDEIIQKIKSGAEFIGDVAKQAVGGDLPGAANKTVDKLEEQGTKFVNTVDKINTKTGIGQQLKGLMKSSMGRPAMYAADTLINGDNCGFWHLTVGNPFNPIMCIGNLRMVSSTVTHTGPLGIDDFPTEIKVVCSLAPGRSRDATEISRYYTRGMGAIYMPKHRAPMSKYHNWSGGGQNYDQLFNQIDFVEPSPGTPERREHDKQLAKKIENEESQKNGVTDNVEYWTSSEWERLQNIQRSFRTDKDLSDDMSTRTWGQGMKYTTGTVDPVLAIRSQDEFA